MKIMKKMMGFVLGITLVFSCCSRTSGQTALYSDPIMPLIQLPVDFSTYRQNSNAATIEPGKYLDMLNVKGPGCVHSIWLLLAEGKRIEIVADGATVPQVNMPAPDFFGTLLGLEPYHINSAAIVSMPNKFVRDKFGGGEPGYTSYLPIPFQDSCRIRIYAETKGGVAGMVNWHKYADDVKITPYRFHVAHKVMNPAYPRGSQMSTADISGAGFIAGIFMGVRQLAEDDLIYHQGGFTFLIDGETNPHAIRGSNMEDDYGFTWGFHETMTPWFGSPYFKMTPKQNTNNPKTLFNYRADVVAYRFMGPDPISFESSMSMKVGTRPDNTETVIYYYKKQETQATTVNTPVKWQITGTLPCKTTETFETKLPEGLLGDWGDSVQIDTEKYKVHELSSDHSWVNFHPLYFTPSWTPLALTEQAAYAKGSVQRKKAGKGILRLAFDDWMGIWVNGEKIGNFYHEAGFRSAEIKVNLRQGENEIILKSVNFDKIQNVRLWAFSLILK